MKEKALKLAKKLKALAERGVGGEKDNVEMMLMRLLKENNLSLEDLEDEITDVRLIKYKGEDQKKFLHQVMGSVMGKFQSWSHAQHPNTIIFESTVADYVEIKAKFRFYFVDYMNQQKLFYKAYIQKNELYRKDSGEKQQEFTPEELEEIMAMASMMKGIQKKTFYKQLEK